MEGLKNDNNKYTKNNIVSVIVRFGFSGCCFACKNTIYRNIEYAENSY
jgi:hypothetical protein